MNEQELKRFEMLLKEDCSQHFKMATFHYRNAIEKMAAEIRRLWGELKDTDNLAFGAMDSYEDESLRRTWLEKEADYLAEHIEWCPDDAPRDDCYYDALVDGEMDRSKCIRCWREAAHKAVRK